MAEEGYTFDQTKVRLDGIWAEVRKKDTSLEQSMELMEEGVRLLARCTDLIDRTGWEPGADGDGEEATGEDGTSGAEAAADDADAEGGEPPALAKDAGEPAEDAEKPAMDAEKPAKDGVGPAKDAEGPAEGADGDETDDAPEDDLEDDERT